jgi:hypothetical protein
VVRRILAVHHPNKPIEGGPSWLTFIGHVKDSLWSLDLFRCESMTLQTYWVLVVMDQYTRRITRPWSPHGRRGESDHAYQILTALKALGFQRNLEFARVKRPREMRSSGVVIVNTGSNRAHGTGIIAQSAASHSNHFNQIELLRSTRSERRSL